MSKLLDEAYAAAKELPEDEQEALGALLLAETDADRRWDELFAQPSEVIERMADRAVEEFRQGRTRSK
jgi:methylase of polypeptide subunit release factors